jgi:hypothetical protein
MLLPKTPEIKCFALPEYDEVKATQIAASFLALSNGRMSHTRLIALMYLVDRAALLRWGRPATFDTYLYSPNPSPHPQPIHQE